MNIRKPALWRAFLPGLSSTEAYLFLVGIGFVRLVRWVAALLRLTGLAGHRILLALLSALLLLAWLILLCHVASPHHQQALFVRVQRC
jgi:ABC-type transport system involved in cytochrome c biogenesis permease subunit